MILFAVLLAVALPASALSLQELERTTNQPAESITLELTDLDTGKGFTVNCDKNFWIVGARCSGQDLPFFNQGEPNAVQVQSLSINGSGLLEQNLMTAEPCSRLELDLVLSWKEGDSRIAVWTDNLSRWR